MSAALYMLDTDTSIYIIKQRPKSVLQHLEKLAHEQVCVSVCTYAELLYGVERSAAKIKNRQALESFIQNVSLRPWSIDVAAHYAELRAALDNAGTPIGAMDLMIAAHARSIDAVVVTNNTKHFGRVSGLKSINWVET